MAEYSTGGRPAPISSIAAPKLSTVSSHPSTAFTNHPSQTITFIPPVVATSAPPLSHDPSPILQPSTSAISTPNTTSAPIFPQRTWSSSSNLTSLHHLTTDHTRSPVSASSPLTQTPPRSSAHGAARPSKGSPGPSRVPPPYTYPATSPCEACQKADYNCTLLRAEGDAESGNESCIQCHTSGVECTVASNPRKRKIGPDGSNATTLGGNQNSGKRPHEPRRHRTLNDYSNISAHSSLPPPPQAKLYSLGEWVDRHGQLVGSSTELEPMLIRLSALNDRDESFMPCGIIRQVDTGRQNSSSSPFIFLPDIYAPGYTHIRKDVEEIERLVYPQGGKLVRLYFDIVHPTFPILHKEAFLEQHAHSTDLPPALLAAVYLLAIYKITPSDDIETPSLVDLERLEGLARTAYADALHRPKLSTVQAGILLSQRPCGEHWANTSQLLAVGQDLGLHLDCSSWKIPAWEKGLRTRLAWALFVQEKWSALTHGRPSHVHMANWMVPTLQASDFTSDQRMPDRVSAGHEETMEKGHLAFVSLVQLTQIVSDILDVFYSIQAQRDDELLLDRKGVQTVLMRAKPLQLKLKEWYSQLPQPIRMEPSFSLAKSMEASGSVSVAATDARSKNNIGFLHLAYFAAEITLHRHIIRSLEVASRSTTQGAEVDPFVHQICRNAAKARLISAMDFVNRLTPPHLRSFWFFASRTNFALIGTFGSLLWATAPSREEADWYRRRLAEYRWTLSVSSKPEDGHDGLTDFAMGMLDASVSLLAQIPEKPTMVQVAKATAASQAKQQKQRKQRDREKRDLEQDRDKQDEGVETAEQNGEGQGGQGFTMIRMSRGPPGFGGMSVFRGEFGGDGSEGEMLYGEEEYEGEYEEEYEEGYEDEDEDGEKQRW